MKSLLTITALIELGAALALLTIPSEAVNLLLGSPLQGPNAAILGRLAGVALFSLSVACWLSRHGRPGGSDGKGVVVAMVCYNAGAVAVLGIAGVQLHPAGPSPVAGGYTSRGDDSLVHRGTL